MKVEVGFSMQRLRPYINTNGAGYGNSLTDITIRYTKTTD